MARDRIQELHLQGFPKGLNREVDPYLLEEQEVPNAINVDFGARGEISRRDGYARIDFPWEIGQPQQRIINWQSENNEFLIVLGGSDRKVWIGSLLYDWTFPA